MTVSQTLTQNKNLHLKRVRSTNKILSVNVIISLKANEALFNNIFLIFMAGVFNIGASGLLGRISLNTLK